MKKGLIVSLIKLFILSFISIPDESKFDFFEENIKNLMVIS